LPKDADIFVITSHPRSVQRSFTPDRLRQLLPEFRPAQFPVLISTDVVTQQGSIVLKDKTVLYWESSRPYWLDVKFPQSNSSGVVTNFVRVHFEKKKEDSNSESRLLSHTRQSLIPNEPRGFPSGLDDIAPPL